MKTKYVDANPQVRVQVEEVHYLLHWRSVIVTGRAERLTQQQGIDRAMHSSKSVTQRFRLLSIERELTPGDMRMQ